ncbi:MAG: hydrogenase iron-sulfur subunit [Gemmatimonadaceae bacterium]
MIDKPQDAESPTRQGRVLTRGLEAAARRVTRGLDVALHRAYGWRWNPLHQSGALAAWLLVVLAVTGTYLLLFYRVGAPAESVRRIADDAWVGAWVRTLHRYATAAFVVSAALHALRLLAQARSWGPRARAWVTGVFLFGVGLACAWTGYVMAWDSFGIRLAVGGARLFDVLPVLSEPVSRIFAGDRPVPEAFFFINLFIHITLPLAMGAGLWLHVSKVARPVLSPPRALRWRVTAVLTAVAVLVPAPLGPAAEPLRLPESTPLDLFTAWWLPLAERSSPWTVWGAALAVTALALFVPRLMRRPRTESWAPSVVDPRLCTGCDQCTQDCPWEAITMVPRDDDRPTLVALVDPARCVSCGICAGSCAPMGIGPPLRTGRDQLAGVRASLVPELADRTDREAQVAVVCCGQVSDDARRRFAAAGGRIHPVPCVGNLHSSVVELLLRQGAAGVMIAGCPPRDCIGREGPKWLEERLYNDREAELQPRVDRRRVRTLTVAAGLEGEAMEAFGEFRSDVLAMEAPDVEGNLDVGAECEPEPTEVVP